MLVPGAVYTHRIEVIVPDDVVSAMRVEPAVPTGTITLGDARLSEKDRDALAAVCRGYLRSFPRRNPHPLTYQEAAEMLGPPWTRITVRKQIERIKERLARNGLYFEGPHANHDLAEHVIDNELLSVEDLARVERRAARP
ncbi:MAG TPA: hypothetical protein VNA57_08960 [Acidimicrobiales bacterium]|nr:hypothetical protein [Acidimicrobiales bacterium]